jgi:hypothetical protein
MEKSLAVRLKKANNIEWYVANRLFCLVFLNLGLFLSII